MVAMYMANFAPTAGEMTYAVSALTLLSMTIKVDRGSCTGARRWVSSSAPSVSECGKT